jgi:glucose/arabinose dehydrogenase
MRPGPLALAALWPALACAQVEQGPPNAPYEPAFANQTRAPALPATAVTAEPFSEPLDNAWGIAPLPDGAFLVTERPSGMRVVNADGTLGELIGGLPQADTREQGGWLDVTVSPNFAADRTVFWTYAKPVGDGLVATAAARGVLSEDGTRMTEVRDIFVQNPSSPNPMHYGSRILLDGDVAVITTGEHSEAPGRELAQDPQAQWGKVIRVTLDGQPAPGNPEGFAPGVWSTGHRNIQGAAFAPDGALWVAEMGPLGGDELQSPQAGLNYGWPAVSYGIEYSGAPVGTGEPRAPGFEEPAYYWDPVIAPGGIDFYEGSLFPDWQGDLLIGGLAVESLVRVRLEGGRVVGEERLLEGQGRVRDVEELPDGSLLLLIDERGAPIQRVTPAG